VRSADPDRRSPDFGWLTRKLAQSGRHPAFDVSAAEKEKAETPEKHCSAYIPSMLFKRMRKRLAAERASFIEPCLPSPADKPPSGSNWIHEIKHDGFRLIARRDPVGIRLITRRGNDWTQRYPLVAEAVNHLKVRSCLIDGEVVCCDAKGVAAFQLLRHRRSAPQAFLYALTFWS
jgi:ATP-dependent DNA ligase